MRGPTFFLGYLVDSRGHVVDVKRFFLLFCKCLFDVVAEDSLLFTL